MELTMTNAINAAATSERELTIDELDAVSGGAKADGIVSSFGFGAGLGENAGGGSSPASPSAVDVWNTLLHQYGF
jgi:hypothetical protein